MDWMARQPSSEERTHNDVNELTAFTSPTNYVDPAHDDAGNMTKFPAPKDLTEDCQAKYDAWNRLVEITWDHDGEDIDINNEYDGLHRRIVRDEDGDKRHFYYNNQWQVVEERVGNATTADKQYIYHPYYVDAIAVRYWDEDGSANDTLETAHYYLQDANFNVTAVVDDQGDVEERYAYTPYGEVTILDSSFLNPRSSSLISNEYMYTGRRRDPETGLQLNRERYYHSGLGRWVNRDPIGYWGSEWNLYEYVNGMPMVAIDPFGLHQGLTCEEQNVQNQRDRVDCLNKSDDDFTDFYRACRGFDGGGGNGSREECEKKWNEEQDRRRANCEQDFPDLDCDDTCTFDPGECAPEAAAYFAAQTACEVCFFFTRNPARCSACYNLINLQGAYQKCLDERATK